MTMEPYECFFSIGDLGTINELLGIVRAIRADSFIYQVAGHDYTAFHTGIKDIKVKDEAALIFHIFIILFTNRMGVNSKAVKNKKSEIFQCFFRQKLFR